MSSRGHKRARRQLAVAGLAIATAILLESYLVAYGLTAIFGYNLLSGEFENVSGNMQVVCAGIAVTAALTVFALGKLTKAVAHMDSGLKHLSVWTWAPMALNVMFLLFQFIASLYNNKIDLMVMLAAYALALLAGCIPALVLSGKNVRKLQGETFFEEI